MGPGKAVTWQRAWYHVTMMVGRYRGRQGVLTRERDGVGRWYTQRGSHGGGTVVTMTTAVTVVTSIVRWRGAVTRWVVVLTQVLGRC